MCHPKFYSLVYLCGNGNPLEIWKAMSIFTCNFCTFSLECISRHYSCIKSGFTLQRKRSQRTVVQGRRGKSCTLSPLLLPPHAPQLLSAWAFGPSAASPAPPQLPRPCPGRQQAQALNPPPSLPPFLLGPGALVWLWVRWRWRKCSWQLKERPPAPHHSTEGFGGLWRDVSGWPPYAVSIVCRIPQWTLRWVSVLRMLPFLMATTKSPFIFWRVFSHLQTSLPLCRFHLSDSSGF